MKIKSIIVLLFLVNSLVYGQRDSMELKPVIGVSLRAGTLTYYGELNKRVIPFTAANKINYGLAVSAKWKFLSMSLNYDMIRFGQTLNTPGDHRNFSAKGGMYGLEINFWPIIKRNYGFYIGSGLSYINYALKTDTLDKNGIPYHYWSDGTIRDQKETYNSIFTSSKIRRDYVYESSLGNRAYLSYPVRAGIMLRFIKDVQFAYNVGFYFTNRKDADGQAAQKSKNYLLYNSASLTWYFNSYDKVDEGKYKDINFKDLVYGDEDKDGVSDWRDKCFGTPKGVKVDSDGCPLDGDKDGTDDYKDQEKNTQKGKLTDLEGVGHEPGDPNNVDQDDANSKENDPEPK